MSYIKKPELSTKLMISNNSGGKSSRVNKEFDIGEQ